MFVGPPTHGLSHENDAPAGNGRGVGSQCPADIRPCRKAGIREHPTGPLGQLLAVGEPERLAVIDEPMGKQGAADDGLAASGGQLEHQPPFGMIRQGVLNTAEKVLLIGPELAHDDAILSTRRPVSKTELRPTPVLTTSGDSTHSDCGLRPRSSICALALGTVWRCSNSPP